MLQINYIKGKVSQQAQLFEPARIKAFVSQSNVTNKNISDDKAKSRLDRGGVWVTQESTFTKRQGYIFIVCSWT